MQQGDAFAALVQIKKIVYPKNTGGGIEPGTWCIFMASVLEVTEGEVYSDSDIVSFKGKVYNLEVGGVYRVKATYENHQKYGQSYIIRQFTKEFHFTNPDQQLLFLKTLTSERIAERICEQFSDPVSVLENRDIEKLLQIKGVSKKICSSILRKYNEQKEAAKAYICLSEYGISITQISSLLKKYCGDADRLVYAFEENPYILADELSGVGWATADRIAQKKGVPLDSPMRIMCGIRYCLNTLAEEGHTWVDGSLLIQNTFPFLGLKEQAIPAFRQCLYDMRDRGQLWWSEDKSKISLSYLHILEENIAKELYRLQSAYAYQLPFDDEIDWRLEEVEKEQGWEFTEEQRDAIRQTLEHNVSIITGSAGVGKSSVVRGVLKVLGNVKFSQCALSGRAAARLSEVTEAPGSTIHRLLKWKGDGPTKGEEDPLEDDVIILDEVSMVGADIFLRLLEAIPTGAKLIMLGDPGQLESIGLCNIFKDMIESGVIHVSRLTKIHRQAAKSAIVTESQRLRKQEAIIPYGYIGTEIRGELQDLKLHIYGDSILSQDIILEEYNNLLEEGVAPEDIQIVVPMKTRGEISTKALNTIIQRKVNFSGMEEKGFSVVAEGGIETLHINDRVLITKNLYRSLRFLPEKGEEETCDVFNGDCGYVVGIFDNSLIINFPQYGHIQFFREDASSIELAYAMTCHKLQGSESPYVIVGLDSSAHLLLTREWLYTAITRAKKRCIVCGESKAISQACATSNVSTKRTMLSELLREEFADHC